MKSYLLDTSVIIAGSIEEHSHHQYAFPWLVAAKNKKYQPYVSAHTLAELYAALTKLPIKPPLHPEFVESFIKQEILKIFTCVDLSVKDYRQAISLSASHSSKGGIIYDGLHLQACRKKDLNGLVTFNIKDFQRLNHDNQIKLINPKTTRP